MQQAHRAAIVLVLMALCAPAGAVEQGLYETATPSRGGTGKFYFHREIAQVMGFEGAAWLERPERLQEERPDLLIKELHLKSGMTVADIGAGSGYLSKRMAPQVAPGRVFAVDVQPEMVDLLSKLSAEPALRNIVAVHGANGSVNLPPSSVDLAVMVDVYHELIEPYDVVQSILRALKPGGQLVFVEYRGEDPAVPISPLHKMTVAQLTAEMQQFPVVLQRRDESLPIQHILIFRKK